MADEQQETAPAGTESAAAPAQPARGEELNRVLGML